MRSLTLIASPSLGLAGVVISGSEDKKETYFLHSVEVKRLRMRMIWSSSSVSKARSVVGSSGCSVGQLGTGSRSSGRFRFVLIEALPRDRCGIAIGETGMRLKPDGCQVIKESER